MAEHVQTQSEWEAVIARRAMELTRSELYIQLRYLNAALGALTLTPDPEPDRGPATNGAALCYGPAWVLRIYRKNRKYLARAYLHSVLHCIFRHPWLRGPRDPALWGLACDIAVEHTLDTLGVEALARPVGWLRQKTYAELKESTKLFAAGPIFRILAQRSPAELEALQQEFYCDSHRLWPSDPEDPAAQMMGRQWEQLGRETQIAMQQAAKIIDVLHDERTVITGRVDTLLQFLGSETATKSGGNRIAGSAHHEEDDGYKNKYCRNDQQKACEHETEESA